MKRWLAMWPLALLVACGVALLASGILGQLAPGQLAIAHWQAIITQHPWLTRLSYLAVLTLVVATGIPASVVVTVAGGLLFGLVDGTVLSTVGMVLGSLLLFMATRMALGKQRRKMPALVERLRYGYARHPGNYTLFLRLIPGVPWGGVTVALAWLRCPLMLFIGATAAGSVVMASIESSIGTAIGKGLARGQKHFDLMRMLLDPYILSSLSALAVLALLPLLFHRLHGTHGNPIHSPTNAPEPPSANRH